MNTLLRSQFSRFATFTAAGLISVSCLRPAAPSRVKDDTQLNPKEIGIALSKDDAVSMQIGIPKTLTGNVTACQSKDRIADCSKATALPLTTKNPTSQRLIFDAGTLDLNKNGHSFAVAVAGTIVLRFKLIDKTLVPTPTPSTDPNPGNGAGSALVTGTFAPLNSDTSADEGILRDIVNHIPANQIATYKDPTLSTWGHETTHGINAYIRNTLNPEKVKSNGFYLLQGKYALVKEPAIRKSAIAPFVPKNLKGSRFDLYVAGQKEWDDRPLYVFDEWTAYINGGAVAVDLADKEQWGGGNIDGVRGIIEFNVYAIATAMAVKAGDPSYFKDYKQFREFIAYNMRRGMVIYNKGSKMPYFEGFGQDEFMTALRTSAEAEALRTFAKEFFGTEWCKEVLGF